MNVFPHDEFPHVTRSAAFQEMLELIDAEIAKHKECGDLTSAECLEMLRAKIEDKGKR